MKIGEIKKKIREFKKSRNLKEVNYDSLSCAAEKLGYTVIEYSSAGNDPDVEILVESLELTEEIKALRGFTYADSNYRLIFVNQDLSEDERTIVIAHELGHITLGHMTNASIFGKDVTDEYEANEFAHFLMMPTSVNKWLIVGISVSGVLLAAGICFLLFVYRPYGKGTEYINNVDAFSEREITDSKTNDEGNLIGNNTPANSDNTGAGNSNQVGGYNGVISGNASNGGSSGNTSNGGTSGNTSNGGTSENTSNGGTSGNVSNNEAETTSEIKKLHSQEEFNNSLVHTYIKSYLDSLPLETRRIQFSSGANASIAYLVAPKGMAIGIINGDSNAINTYREVASILDDYSGQIQNKIYEMGYDFGFAIFLLNDTDTNKVIYASANGSRVPGTPYY